MSPTPPSTQQWSSSRCSAASGRALAATGFPKPVVSGGHHPGFDSTSAEQACTTGASLAVVQGAGHEIQFTGDAINQGLSSSGQRTATEPLADPDRPTPWHPGSVGPLRRPLAPLMKVLLNLRECAH